MKRSGARTRRAYIAEALLEYMVSLLVTGAFLAAILKQVGVSDALTGVVSSFISFACVAQLFSSLIVKKGGSVKRRMLVLALINELMFSTLYIIPFVPLGQNVKTALFVVMILGAYLILNLTTPVKYKWLMSFVGANERGRFTANKEIVSLIGGMLFTLGMGRLVDCCKEIGREQTGFILCGATMVAVSLLHMVSILLCDDEPENAPRPQGDNQLRAIFSMIAGNRTLRKLLLLDILWKTAIYISTSYYGTYLIGELGFSLTFVSALGVVYGLVRALASPQCGRIADRRGWSSLLTLCLIVAAAGFLVNVFTRPESRMLYLAHYVLYAASMAGINSGLTNITYDYIDEGCFAQAMGARNAVSGIVGFLASLMGGAIVSRIQAAGNTLFGLNVYAQQVNSAITFALLIALLVYTRLVIARMPRLSGEKSAS